MTKMPWDGPIHLTRLSDGSTAFRGSRNDAIDKFGEELVKSIEENDG
jgi:hypothetical protein